MRGNTYYVLDEEKRPKTATPAEWADFFENHDERIVRQTTFDPDILVSTVFLGLDHRFFGAGPPILFETMVFGINAEDEAMTARYCSWDDALTGHVVTVGKVMDLLVKASLKKTVTT